MEATTSFYDTLVAELETMRAALPPDEGGSFFNRAMTEQELIEWLSFQAYYEKRAAQFIGKWLADTPERDAFVLLAQQVEDEGLHYEYCMRALERRGVTSIDNWKPEPEWEEWIDSWYPSGDDTIERVASHNLAGELGACNAFIEIKTRVPDDVVKTLDRIIPDEHFHMRIANTLIDKYAVNEDQQARVRHRVVRTFELEQAGRVAYNRRMVNLGLADPGDPVPPMPG
ncbi:MAG: rubrerythrin [Verrucomicrobiales bacterium]|jgi:rubrerythrin